MRKAFFLLSGIATFTFFACNNQVPPAGGSNTALEATTWKLTSLGSLPNGLPKLPQEVTLRLDTGRVTGYAGCNRYFGSYTTSGSELSFNGVGSTKMFCEDGMKVEEGLLQSFSNTQSFHIDANALALLKGSDTLARFTVDKDTAQ